MNKSKITHIKESSVIYPGVSQFYQDNQENITRNDYTFNQFVNDVTKSFSNASIWDIQTLDTDKKSRLEQNPNEFAALMDTHDHVLSLTKSSSIHDFFIKHGDDLFVWVNLPDNYAQILRTNIRPIIGEKYFKINNFDEIDQFPSPMVLSRQFDRTEAFKPIRTDFNAREITVDRKIIHDDLFTRINRLVFTSVINEFKSRDNNNLLNRAVEYDHEIIKNLMETRLPEKIIKTILPIIMKKLKEGFLELESKEFIAHVENNKYLYPFLKINNDKIKACATWSIMANSLKNEKSMNAFVDEMNKNNDYIIKKSALDFISIFQGKPELRTQICGKLQIFENDSNHFIREKYNHACKRMNE